MMKLNQSPYIIIIENQDISQRNAKENKQMNIRESFNKAGQSLLILKPNSHLQKELCPNPLSYSKGRTTTIDWRNNTRTNRANKALQVPFNNRTSLNFMKKINIKH